jgi:hypothetical protein
MNGRKPRKGGRPRKPKEARKARRLGVLRWWRGQEVRKVVYE